MENPDYGRFGDTMENGLGLHGHLHMFLTATWPASAAPRTRCLRAPRLHRQAVVEWQKMHNELGSPAYKETPRASLPVRERLGRLLRGGYGVRTRIRCSGPERLSTLPRYLELGGEEDIVALGRGLEGPAQQRDGPQGRCEDRPEARLSST